MVGSIWEMLDFLKNEWSERLKTSQLSLQIRTLQYHYVENDPSWVAIHFTRVRGIKSSLPWNLEKEASRVQERLPEGVTLTWIFKDGWQVGGA